MRWIPPPRKGAPTALVARGACLLAGLTFFSCTAAADSSVQVIVGDSTVAIEAENTSIRRILESIAAEAGLVVHSDLPLAGRVTVSKTTANIADAIAHILRSESYMLLMSGDEFADCLAACGRLWVLSGGSDADAGSWSTPQARFSGSTRDTDWENYQLLANSSDDMEREQAMFGLGELGHDSSIDLLKRGLVDANRSVREAAIESLADIGGNRSVAALGIALADPDPGLRISALDALGAVGGPKPKSLIQQALNDSDSNVREAAGNWMTELDWRR